MLCCVLKLVTGFIGSGAFWEGLQCRPKLVAAWEGLKSDLCLVAACAGPGGMCKRSFCELELAATNTSLGAIPLRALEACYFLLATCKA